MVYLLAKYALTFILAAIAGFVFGRWMTRRKIVDVTESYEDRRIASSKRDVAQWDRLWSRLDSNPEPKEINLAGVNERLDALAYAVTNLPVRPAVTLASVEGMQRAVSEVVGGLSTHADISALSAKLEKVDDAIRRNPQPVRAPNLAPIQSDLAALRKDVRSIYAVNSRPPADPALIDDRLRAIESALKELSERPVKTSRPRALPARAPSTESNALKEAMIGKKDDLRLISGIGPKFERLLNENGIFYFWQIANWTDSDREFIEARLDTFRGRIGRDGWVSQADRYRREPESAQQPTEMRISA